MSFSFFRPWYLERSWSSWTSCVSTRQSKEFLFPLVVSLQVHVSSVEFWGNTGKVRKGASAVMCSCCWSPQVEKVNMDNTLHRNIKPDVRKSKHCSPLNAGRQRRCTTSCFKTTVAVNFHIHTCVFAQTQVERRACCHVTVMRDDSVKDGREQGI